MPAIPWWPRWAVVEGNALAFAASAAPVPAAPEVPRAPRIEGSAHM
jgi:hypothetical protein